MSSYHHGNLRQALIDEAVELARTTGPDGVVLREVARRAGVSHNAAYRHFADREALMGAVAGTGMVRLEDAMNRRLAEVRTKDPAKAAVARLRAVGRAYVEFALTEPGLFAVAFAGIEVGAEQATGPGAYGLLNMVLDEGVAAGAFRADSRLGADIACWAAVHGFAELHLRGPLHPTPAPERDASLELVLDHVERGLR